MVVFVGNAQAVVINGADDSATGSKTTTTTTTRSTGITNPVLQGGFGSDKEAAKSGSLFAQIISGLLSFIMVLASLLVLLSLIQAAIEWIGSGGDKGKLESARNRILNAVIGIIVLAASVAIWQIVNQFLGLELTLPRIFAPTS